MSIEMDNQDVSGFAGDAFEGTRSERPAQSGAVGSPPCSRWPWIQAHADCWSGSATSFSCAKPPPSGSEGCTAVSPRATPFRRKTSDLVDIRKAAREAASEREQLVAISDLINAFPKANGRLTYGSGDGSKAVVLMERIEQGLVPRVAEAMTRIEAEVQEATRRYQSVQSLLQDLNSRQSAAAEQRQIELMEQIRRQVREAADVQLGAVLREFGERLEAKFTELNLPAKPIEPEPEPQRYEPAPPVHKPRPSYWSWLAL